MNQEIKELEKPQQQIQNKANIDEKLEKINVFLRNNKESENNITKLQEKIIENDYLPEDLYNEEDFDYFQYHSVMKNEEMKVVQKEQEEIKAFNQSRQNLVITPKDKIDVILQKDFSPEKKDKKKLLVKFITKSSIQVQQKDEVIHQEQNKNQNDNQTETKRVRDEQLEKSNQKQENKIFYNNKVIKLNSTIILPTKKLIDYDDSD